MQVWTLAYHNRTGTGAAIFVTETDAYQALITMVVNPEDAQSLVTAKKLLFLRELEELCRYLQENHFGELDDYCIQAHNLTFITVIPDNGKA